MSTRVAAIDCGTNSIRLLIGDRSGGEVHDVLREMRIVRLGAGVDRTGEISPEALERTRAALSDYADLIRGHGAQIVRMVATSASRDARNREDFASMVLDILGVGPEVIGGTEEASLSFLGASHGLAGTDGCLLVCDVGGGSTELVQGERGGVLHAVSMDVGCVRMTERHLPDDPPNADQVDAVVGEVRAALAAARAQERIDSQDTVIAVAGTATTLAALALGLDRYDADAVHGARISTAQLAAVTDRLLTMSRRELAAEPVIHPGRVDVIVAGALVLRTVLVELGATTMIASEHDILDGIALSLGTGLD